MATSPTSGPGAAAFSGGTITDALVVATNSASEDPIFKVQAPAGAEANGTYLARFVSDIAASMVLDTDASCSLTNLSAGGTAVFQAVDSAGALLVSSPGATSPLRLSVSGTGNTFRVTAAGAIITAAHAAPADGALVAGECALWFDQTNGAAKLMAKGKTADGTVVTAAVPLA